MNNKEKSAFALSPAAQMAAEELAKDIDLSSPQVIASYGIDKISKLNEAAQEVENQFRQVISNATDENLARLETLERVLLSDFESLEIAIGAGLLRLDKLRLESQRLEGQSPDLTEIQTQILALDEQLHGLQFAWHFWVTPSRTSTSGAESPIAYVRRTLDYVIPQFRSQLLIAETLQKMSEASARVDEIFTRILPQKNETQSEPTIKGDPVKATTFTDAIRSILQTLGQVKKSDAPPREQK